MEPEIAAAHWSMGYLRSHQLPEIALAWLEAGLDSPTMGILIGESQPILSEVRPMFERTLAELKIEVPSRPEAAMWLARRIAEEISNGCRSPYGGAKEIWSLSRDCEQANIPEAFGNLADAYEDFGEHQNFKFFGEERWRQVLKEIESEILEEARKLLTS